MRLMRLEGVWDFLLNRMVRMIRKVFLLLTHHHIQGRTLKDGFQGLERTRFKEKFEGIKRDNVLHSIVHYYGIIYNNNLVLHISPNQIYSSSPFQSEYYSPTKHLVF